MSLIRVMFQRTCAIPNHKILAACMVVGGTLCGGKSVYDSYKIYRHHSYSNCVTQTVLAGVFGISIGMAGGVGIYFMKPIVIPILCVTVPIATGTFIIQYLEKNHTSP